MARLRQSRFNGGWPSADTFTNATRVQQDVQQIHAADGFLVAMAVPPD